MKRNLVLVRCGPNSLHHNWISEHSSYDLILLPYTHIDQVSSPECQVAGIIEGQKWPAIYDFCIKNLDLLAQYQYIFMPDDDLFCSSDLLETLFSLVDKYRPAVAQSSLTHSSYFSHFITLQFPGLVARETSFVEIMAPVFHKEFFLNALWTFNQNNSGWGVEALWNRLCSTCSFLECTNKQIIFDSIAIHHTRPVGGQSRGLKTGERGPHEDESILLRNWNVRQYYNIKSLILDINLHSQSTSILMSNPESDLIILDSLDLIISNSIAQQDSKTKPKHMLLHAINFCKTNNINLTHETPLIKKYLHLVN